VITARAFADKHYAVLGLARSGLATVEALLASGARVTAWDDKEEARAKVPKGAKIEDFVEGDLTQFDSIVVTPGLPLNRHPIAKRAADAGVEIIGDIELFARARSELPSHKVVGITGTNGKSTTTALIHHILKTAGVPATMGGNIGLPILAQDPLPTSGVYVLELSSYQIDLTQSLDCDVAVLLNITPDHLDRYESFEAYADSKMRLLDMQLDGQNSFIGQDANLSSLALLSEQHEWPALQGPHNRQNAWASILSCRVMSIDDSTIRLGLRTFPGLPYRMERVLDRSGVLFVNDSKATNAEAAAPALAAYPKVRWIVGGQAKSETLGDTAHHLDHIVKAYTIGEAGPMFAQLLRAAGVDVEECETLENATKRAAADSQPGETVLLSPASASFDQFRDFEARGDRVRELVEGL
jgi:UDP-N-acetylmuramoylalanine--D-glutamate ligase